LRISQDSIFDEVKQLEKAKSSKEVEEKDLVFVLVGVSQCD